MEYGIRKFIVDNPAIMVVDMVGNGVWGGIIKQWIEIYKWVNSLPKKERPSKSTIASIVLFDRWIEQYSNPKNSEGGMNIITSARRIGK